MNIRKSIKNTLIQRYIYRTTNLITNHEDFWDRAIATNDLITYKKISIDKLKEDIQEFNKTIEENNFLDIVEYNLKLHNQKISILKPKDTGIIDFRLLPKRNEFYNNLILYLEEETRKQGFETIDNPALEFLAIKKIISKKEDYLELHERNILESSETPKSEELKRYFALEKLVIDAKKRVIEEIAKVVYD